MAIRIIADIFFHEGNSIECSLLLEYPEVIAEAIKKGEKHVKATDNETGGAD